MTAPRRQSMLSDRRQEGVPVNDELHNDTSIMEETGLGLLPGVVIALGLVVFSMALLLTGSMWAVAAVLALIGAVTTTILTVVFAVMDDSEAGRRMRERIPGL
jgi:uncharacterized membrane protein